MNVFVSGASRGIGLGFVNYYLNQGCHVWASYRTEAGALADLADSRLQTLCWDVQQAPSDQALSALPAALDLLINNAGIYGPKKAQGQSLESVSAETMHEVFDVNCVGALRVVQQLWSRLVQGDGVIANVSSKMGSSGDNSSGGCYAYRAAKAALVIVSRSMARDLADHGIKVITLHPGWVRTDMTDHSGLVDIDESVSGMARVIAAVDDYEPGAFVAFDGKVVPY